MGPLLAERLGLAPASSHVLDAKYEPGVRCTVLHQLGSELITVRLSLDGDDPADGRGPGRGAGARAFRFPDDPSCAGLAAAMDPVWLGPRLGEALGTDLRLQPGQLVRYRPAKRATLRVEGVVPDRRRARRCRQRLFAKIYHRATKAAAVYDEARRLVAMGRGPGGPRAGSARSPFLADVPMVVHERVDGHAARRAARGPRRESALACGGPPRSPPCTEPAGQPPGALRSTPSWPASVDGPGPSNGWRRPSGTSSGLLASRPASPRRPTVEPAPLGPGPRRLQAQPVPARRRRASTLLDLDHCGLAEPASDVGTFLATLRQQALRGALAGRPGDPLPAEQRFLDAYRVAADADDRLVMSARWYQAVALCRKALRAFARSPRSPLAVALGAEAARLTLEDP